jgi:hypothetical protein
MEERGRTSIPLAPLPQLPRRVQEPIPHGTKSSPKTCKSLRGLAPRWQKTQSACAALCLEFSQQLVDLFFAVEGSEALFHVIGAGDLGLSLADGF